MTRPTLFALCAVIFGAVDLLTLSDPGLHTALFAIVAVACAVGAWRGRVRARPQA